MSLVCSKCHESVDRLMIFAILHDLPMTRMSWDPSKCNDGEDHVLVERAPVQKDLHASSPVVQPCSGSTDHVAACGGGCQ